MSDMFCTDGGLSLHYCCLFWALGNLLPDIYVWVVSCLATSDSLPKQRRLEAYLPA